MNTRTEFFDRIITVKDEDAIAITRQLAREEGLFAGISTGAAVSAAWGLAQEYPGRNVLVIAPDAGERYLSTELFSD
ncbi:O-acetylserine sulfhydrylase [compost metagenome]